MNWTLIEIVYPGPSTNLFIWVLLLVCLSDAIFAIFLMNPLEYQLSISPRLKPVRIIT